MSLHHIYSNASNSTQDITAYVRLYQWSATTDAKEGSAAHSTMVVDDPDGILDFVGHRRIYSYEDLAAPSNQVVYNGFIQNQKVSRGPYRTGTGRIWTLDLADQNVLLHRRLMNGADANRPAENDVQRMEALIGRDDGIPMTELNTIDDSLYFSGVSPVDMDAVDYRTQPVGTGYIDDCAQASGKNHFVWYRESLGEFSLWYDFAASSNWSSTIRLSNVLSDVDGVTTFAVDLENEAVLDRDPSRVASGIMLPFSGVAVGSNTVSGTVYVQDQDTTDTFAAIDWLAPSLNVKTKAKAEARALRYLADAAEQDDLIHASVKLPAANVNDIMAGMRVQARFEHFPGYGTSVSWMRCLSRTVTEISEDPTRAYRLDLELSPITPPPGIVQLFTHTTHGGCERGNWDVLPGAGNLLVGYAAQRGISGNYQAGSVPIGNTSLVGVCDDVQDIAGTEWTYITSQIINGNEYPGTMAMRYPSAVAEPQGIRWGGAAGFSGSAGTRSHQVEVSGLVGTCTVNSTSAGFGNTGTVFTSHSIAVPGAGYIFAGFLRMSPGPADGSSAAYTMTARAPAFDLTQGYADAGFAPNSWFGGLHVDSAGSYTITLDMSGTPRDPGDPWSWVMGFFPE
jgi:hypothetical protein